MNNAANRKPTRAPSQVQLFILPIGVLIVVTVLALIFATSEFDLGAGTTPAAMGMFGAAVGVSVPIMVAIRNLLRSGRD